MAVLEDSLRNVFLKDHVPHPAVISSLTPNSSRNASRTPDANPKDPFNAVVLSRVLHLVFLLDKAKQRKPSIISTDPPLFRFGSNISSSKEVILELQKHFLPDHGDVPRFLSFRGYEVNYLTPLFERNSLTVRRLDKDLRDGFRLCKLASLLTRDPQIVARIRRERNGMSGKDLLSCRLGNVSLALNKMQEYAASRLAQTLKWKASYHDIVGGDIDKTIAVLWQISSLWLQINVLDQVSLTSELKKVQQEFREARQRSPVSKWSPNGTRLVPIDDGIETSPSRLTVYESCETKVGHLLLRWCATVAGMYGIAVRDFTESFRDAGPLCVILHHYCPELIKPGEFCRVNQADLRSVKDSETESQIVQENFNLFTSRVRLLGDIPDIPIRSEAALAPPFFETKKNESFGRLMELLSSYLFRRLTLEREGGNSLRLPDCFLMQPGLPARSSPRQSGTPCRSSTPASQKQSSQYLGDSRDRELAQEMQLGGHGKNTRKESPFSSQPSSSSKRLSLSRDRILRGGNSARETSEIEERSDLNVDGGHSLISPETNGYPHSTPMVRSADHHNLNLSSSQKDAARVILRLYRAKKRQRDFRSKRDSAVTIQACFRGHLIREGAKSMMCGRSVSGLREALEIDDPSDLKEGFKSAKSSPIHIGNLAKTYNSDQGLRALNATKIVLDRTALLLPLLRDHMQGMKDFSARMILHERTQASLAVQRSFRAHLAARTAVVSTSGGIEREPSTMPWLRLTSGAFRIARSIASEVLSHFEIQRKEAINVLSSGLRSAEDAYEIQMSLCRDRDMHKAETDRYRREQFLAVQKKHSDEDLRAAQALEEDMSSLDKDEVELLSRFNEASAIPDSDNDSMHPEDKLDLEVLSNSAEISDEPNRPGDAPPGKAHNQLSLEKVPLSVEWQKIQEGQQSILDDIMTTQAELSANFEARDEELQRWRELVFTAALFKSEYEFESYMASADNSRAQYVKKSSARASEISILNDEIACLKREEENELAAFSNTLDDKENRCLHSEEEANCKLVATSNRICLAYKALDDLKAAEDRQRRATFCSAIQAKSLDFEVSRFHRDWEEFDSYRKAANSEHKILDETIRKMEQEELREESREKLRHLLEKAETGYNVAMSESLAKAKKREIARDEHTTRLAVISREEKVSRENFDESIRSLNNALTGLDKMMEERRSYIGALSTPISKKITLTPAVSTGRNSELKVTPTPGTMCQELIKSVENSLNLIDVQRSLRFDDGKQVHDSAESSESGLDEEQCEEHFSPMPTSLYSDVDLEASGTGEMHEKLVDNLRMEEDVLSIAAERKTMESNFNRKRESTSENTLGCPVSDSIQGNDEMEPLSGTPVFDGVHVSDNECANPSIATISYNEKRQSTAAYDEDVQYTNNTSGLTTEPALAVAPVSSDADVAVDGSYNVSSIGLDAQTEGSMYSGDQKASPLRNADQNMCQSSLPESSSLLDSEVARRENEPYVAHAFAETEADQASTGFVDSLQEGYDGLSDGDEISDWTNETTRGSPLPQELSPNWTGKTGSSLTSKRSSIRDSNVLVLTPIENRMSHRGSGGGSEKHRRTLSPKRFHQVESEMWPPGESQDILPAREGLGQLHENNPPEVKMPEVDERIGERSNTLGPNNTPSNQGVFCLRYSSPQIPVQAEHQQRDSNGKTIGTFDAAAIVSSHPDSYHRTGSAQTASSARGATERWLESASRRGPSLSPYVSPSTAWADHTPTARPRLLSSFLRSNAFSSLEKTSYSDWGSVRAPVWDSSYKAATPSSGGLSVLRRLSIELSELKREISRESSLEKLEMSKNEVNLGSVLRRISIASAAHASQEGEETTVDAVEDFSVLNIIRIICTIMRKYRRSKPHIELVLLGILILRDICASPKWVDNIFLAEDCLGEIVRCVQFHRDNEHIMVAAVEALLAISSYSHGASLLDGRKGYLKKLRRVSHFLQLQAQRERECGERMRKTNIILRAIENRRKNQSGGYFADELSIATKEVPEFKLEGRRSVQLLQSLLHCFPSMSEGAT